MVLRLLESLISSLVRNARKPAFWLVVVLFIAISIPYYYEALHPPFVQRIFNYLDIDRLSFERTLYIVPIILSGFLFGSRGAYMASVVALGCMVPRAVLISPHTADALFESGTVFLVGILVGFTFTSLQKERKRRMQVDALNQTALVVSQSLELDPVLKSSVDSVVDVMKVDIAQVFLVDEKAGDLTLADYKGISRKFAQGVDRLKIGEGLNGLVAQTGVPTYVEDASTDPRLTRTVLKEDHIGSMLIVPLKSKEKVMGTLCVSMRGYRKFNQDEVELLTNIGNQIGVAIENVRLYQQQRGFTEQLRASEERYRELFENANDGIWVHDLEGNIIAANKASEKLTGYTLDELAKNGKLNVSVFLNGEGLSLAKEIRRKLLANEPLTQPYEQRIIRGDGTEAILMMTTNLVSEAGKPVAFQHIARDVTEEKRMRENLHFYLQQITRAQEEERKRIARELHDDTMQYLVVLARELDELAYGSKAMSDEEKARLENLRQQTTGIMEGVRRLSHDLRPATLDRLGLLPALEWLATQVPSGINIEVKAYGIERRLPAEEELVLFRIAQEALSNVRRHSQATEAEVRVEFEDKKTRITIRDNGKGFILPETMGDLVKAGRLGLAGMQERIQLLNGSLKIESEPGKGTTVTVEAPI
jgi:PAS domain S-box-containing protein